MIYICNAISLSMLPRWSIDPEAASDGVAIGADLRIRTVDDPAAYLAGVDDDIESAVGHADTAALFTAILGRGVEARRVSVEMADDVTLLVGQYIGPRLPEGTTALPEGARVLWATVDLA